MRALQAEPPDHWGPIHSSLSNIKGTLGEKFENLYVRDRAWTRARISDLVML